MRTNEEIFESIRQDPDNTQFTEQGIDPLYHFEKEASILIVSQAPSRSAQATETYWRDASGNRLREWMNVTEDEFYHSGKIAVVPLDFYYLGKGKSGDLPPRKGFAEKWHQPILELMPNIQLTLLIGMYAQKYYLPNRKKTLTETVAHYSEYAPYFPIVHPSPLNYGWMNRHPWFTTDVLPDLQGQVRALL